MLGSTYYAGLNKIDEAATDGLLGTVDSLAYRMDELGKHHHSPARWRGLHGAPSGTDWADDVLTPFVAISGANAYGADANDEAEVLGTADTPIIAGSAYYDLSRILILDVSVDTVYKLRIVWGTGTMADAITALQYSEFVALFDATSPQLSAGIPVVVQTPRILTDTKLWIQAWNVTNNATIDFLVEVHEYEG